jgi:hypothetical protein
MVKSDITALGIRTFRSARNNVDVSPLAEISDLSTSSVEGSPSRLLWKRFVNLWMCGERLNGHFAPFHDVALERSAEKTAANYGAAATQQDERLRSWLA